MINNVNNNRLTNYLNKTGKGEAGVPDAVKRFKEKQSSIQNGGDESGEEKAETAQKQQDKALRLQRPSSFDMYSPSTIASRLNKAIEAKAAEAKAKEPEADAATEENESAASEGKTADTPKRSTEEQRKAEIQAILDKINAEEAQKNPDKAKGADKTNKADKTNAATGVISPEAGASSPSFENFLNEMPLFNEFKNGLIDAFKSLDSATSGSISAQYQLNYTTMQYVAAEGGGYEYKETSLSINLDLNYVKAAGGQSTKDIVSALEGAEDFESFVSALQGIGGGQESAADSAAQALGKGKGLTALTGMSKDEIKAALEESVKSYWSPESTSGRIIDFATMFFPMSDEFKNGGDTEEARQAFADRMGKAIQKGFDQALGSLGKLPKSTSEEIDKTHELVFQGLEDFVKNGLNKEKEKEGVYDSLNQFAMSFQMNYSEKTVSVSGYNNRGATQNPLPGTLNTEA